MGLFTGRRPKDLGVHDGQLLPCSWKPNCVNSMTDAGTDPSHAIAPFKLPGTPDAGWAALVALVRGRERVTIVKEESGYLHAEFKSRGMGYVDDVEFLLDAKGGVVQVRSASRLGIRDFGVNRARIESIRDQFSRS
jgi:uncharacterized protein (DUF1499 family)